MTGDAGQKAPAPQPAVIPRATSSLIHRAKGLLHGTSENSGVVHGTPAAAPL